MKKKLLIYGTVSIAVILALMLWIAYRSLFGIAVSTGGKSQSLYIPTGSTYQQALDTIESNLGIKDPRMLDWIARKKNYPSHIRPGRYVIEKETSYNGLINLLRSGKQVPVKVTFNNVRTLNQLAGRIGSQIEADSVSIVKFLSDPSNFTADGFTPETVISVFIPDTYEFYWNTGAQSFYRRMLREYRLFWNEARTAKAAQMGLDPLQVSILASIIDDEVVKADEKPRIAGVYLNRLKRGMPLQACPTIKFALNDFTITRILYKHLQVESPYNTYTHTGFPPGPISCPSVEGIEAVLHAEDHDYLFFAAKPDFSGYHNFSRTLAEHNRYAAMYQRELDRRKIFK